MSPGLVVGWWFWGFFLQQNWNHPKVLAKTLPKQIMQRNCMGWCSPAAWCPSTCDTQDGTWDEIWKVFHLLHGTLKPIWRKQPLLAIRHPKWTQHFCCGPTVEEIFIYSYRSTKTEFCQIKGQTAFMSWPSRPTMVHTLPCRKNPCDLMARKNMFAHFTMYLHSWNNLFCGSTCNMFQGNWSNI